MANPFGSGSRPWRRITEALRLTDSTILGKGEIAVNDQGQIFPPDGNKALKDISPLIDAASVAAKYLTLPGGTKASGKVPVAQADNSVQWALVSKADIGLSNVNNTADLDKPISSATQVALDAKSTISSSLVTNLPSLLQREWSAPL